MEDILKKIGLSKEEINVYSTIVRFGPRTVGQIQVYVNRPVDEITAALDKLISRGYITKIEAKNKEATPYYVPVPPPIKLTEDITLRLESELNSITKELLENWNTTMKALREQLSELNQGITDKAQNHSAVIEEVSKKLLTDTEEVLTSTTKGIENIKSKTENEAETIATTNTENFAKTIDRIEGSITETFTQTIRKIGEFHENFKGKIEETLENLKEDHKKRLEGHLGELQEAISNLQLQLDDKLTSYQEEQERIKGLVTERTNETFVTLQEEAKTIGKEANESAKKVMDTTIKEYETATEKYVEDLKTKLSSLNEELQTLKDNTSQKIEETIVKSKEIAVNVLNTNEQQFIEVIDNTKKLAVEKLSELIKQTGNTASEMKRELETNLLGYLEEFKNNSGTLIQQLTDGINSGFSQFNEGLSNAITTLNNQINDLKKEVDSYIDDFTKSFAENAETFSNKINELLSQKIEDFKTISEGIEKENNKKIERMNTELTIRVQEIIQNSANQTSAAEKQLKAAIKLSKDKILENKKKAISNINQATENKKKEISDFFNNTTAQFEEEVEETKANMNETISNYISNLDTVTQEFNTAHLEFQEQVIAKLAEIKTDIINNFRVEIDANIQSFEKILQEENEKIQKALTEKAEEFTKEGREIRDTIPEQLDIAERTIEEQITEITTSIGQTYKAMKEILQQFAELDEKKLQKAFGKEQGTELFNQIDNMQANLNNQHNQLQSTLEERKATIITTLSSVSSESYEGINKRVEAFKELVTKSQSDIEQQCQAIQKRVTESLEKVFTNLQTTSNESYSNFEEQFKQIHDSGIEQIETIIGKEKHSIQATNETFINSSEGVLAKIKTFIENPTSTNLFTEHASNFEQFANGVEKDVDTAFSTIEKEFSTVIKGITDALKAAEKSSQTDLAEIISKLQQVNTDIHTQAINTLSSVIETAQTELTSTVGATIEDSTKISTDKKEVLAAGVTRGTETLDKEKEKISAQLSEENEKVIETLQNTIETNITDHEKAVNELTSAISTTIENLQNELNKAETALDTDVSTTLEEAMVGYKDKTKAVEDEIDQLINDTINDFQTNADNLLGEFSVSTGTKSALDEIVATMKSQLKDLGNKYPKSLDNEQKGFVSTIQTKLAEYQEKTQTHIDDLVRYVHTSLSNFYHDVGKLIDADKNKLNDKFEKILNEYELNVTHQVNTYVTNSDSNSAALVTNIQSTKDSIIEAAESAKTAVSQDLTDFTKLVKDVFATTLNEINQKVAQIKKDSQVISKDKSSYTKELQNFTTEYGTKSREQIAKMEKEVTAILNAIPSKINEVLEASGESMKIIKTVLSLGEGIKPSAAEDLWLVVGKEQVEAALQGLLNHTKRSATIVTPDLDWLKPEVLSEYGKSLDLLSAVAEFPAPLKKALEEREKKGIVRPVNTTTVKIDTIILGYRDGVEEGVFGCITPDGTPALLVTMNEKLVETIGKTISLVRMGQF